MNHLNPSSSVPHDPRGEPNLIVALIDHQPNGVVYHPSFLRLALLGALVGGLIGGWFGYALAEGVLPVAGLGQFAASGPGVATFVGAGLGFAAGGLLAGLVALFRVPRPAIQNEGSSQKTTGLEQST